MKKIINWTFGSVFRTFGRILAFLIIGFIGALILQKNNVKLSDLLGLYTVNASELVSTNLSKFYVRTCDANDNCDWSSSSDMGTAISTGAVYLDGFRGRFGSNNKFTAGVKYRVKFNVAMTNASENSNCDIWYQKPREIYCSGSTSSSWSSDADLIESCQYVSRSCYSAGGQIRAHYYYDIVPNTTIYGFQINTYFKDGYTFNVGGLNVMTSSNVSYDRDTTDAINNSTTTIINNNTENTQEIINQLQESATQTNDKLNEVMESQNVCKNLSISDAPLDGYIGIDGNFHEQYGYNKSTNFINIENVNTIKLLKKPNFNKYACFYDIDKTMIRCDDTSSLSNGYKFNIPTNAVYFRSNFDVGENLPIYSICSKGNQAIYDIGHGINEGIHDNNTNEATNEASNFFNNFTTNTHGLTSIITAPLTAITSITSSTCTPLHLPIPYLDNQYLDLPCMRQVYETNFGSFITLYDTITFGIVSYWILVRIFALVKDFKNPDHDEIEVVDL